MLIDWFASFVQQKINCIEIIRVKKCGLIDLYLKQVGRRFTEPYYFGLPPVYPVDVDLAERVDGLTMWGLLS